jgi:hypothetical protein
VVGLPFVKAVRWGATSYAELCGWPAPESLHPLTDYQS